MNNEKPHAHHGAAQHTHEHHETAHAQHDTPEVTTHHHTSTQKKHHTLKRITIVFAVVLFALLLAAGALAATILGVYKDTVLPRTALGSIDLSGKTLDGATETFTASADLIEQQGLSLRVNDDQITIPGTITAEDAGGTDLVLFDIDAQKSVEELFAIGHTGSPWERLQSGVLHILFPQHTPIHITVDREQITAFLDSALAKYEVAPENATIAIEDGKNLNITPEKNGKTINRTTIIDQITDRLYELNQDQIDVTIETAVPALTAKDIQTHEADILGLLQHTPLQLTYEDKTWDFDASSVGSWLMYTKDGASINTDALRKSLDDKKLDIEVAPKEGKWKVEATDNKVTAITPLSDAVVGKKIDTDALATKIIPALENATDDTPRIALSLIEEQPKFGNTDAKELPVKELLGTGHSNMTGSPYNRQLNIRRGADLLNGLVIAQGEEFSLLEALKPFSEGNGYHAELVIKGNETLPEIGGGLCQVGTTTFRAAMNAGLDITRRQNHSYAVSYYSDDRNGLPGTDATIYDPAPDFRFINDTSGPIIIQTRIEGTHLYFDFWGNSDGRKGEFSAPTISGWIQPPPVKEVETDTLPEGGRKCTETAHPGTTASFKYTVTKADGTTHEETFTSVYKPWQAVCLVGKKKAAPAPAAPAKTETKKDTKKDTKKTDKKTNSNSSTSTKQ